MTDSRPVDPAQIKYVVDDSKAKASITTILSLLFFGISLFTALMRLLSARDINGIRDLLLRDDTIGWIQTVAVLLAPTFWLAWRTVRAWFKKAREVDLTDTSTIAIRKSEAQALLAPPTRARGTTTGLRVVPIAQALSDVPAAMDLPATAAPAREVPPAFRIDAELEGLYWQWASGGGRGDESFASYMLAHGWREGAPNKWERVPAVDAAATSVRADAFAQAHATWMATGADEDRGSFADHLRECGWRFVPGKGWVEPAGSSGEGAPTVPQEQVDDAPVPAQVFVPQRFDQREAYPKGSIVTEENVPGQFTALQDVPAGSSIWEQKLWAYDGLEGRVPH